MKKAQEWIELLVDVSTERDHRQWVEAIQSDARAELLEQNENLRQAAKRHREHIGFQARKLVRQKRTIEMMNAAHLALMIEREKLLTARIASQTL
jgi:hypothetical protein